MPSNSSVKCCFNENSFYGTPESLRDLLVKTVKEFVELKKKFPSDDLLCWIITHTQPGSISHGDFSLSDCLQSIRPEDRDLQRAAYRYFCKYPLEKELEGWTDPLTYLSHDFLVIDSNQNSHDWTYAAFVNDNGGILFSLATDWFKTDKILVKKDGQTYCNPINLHWTPANTKIVQDGIFNQLRPGLHPFECIRINIDEAIFSDWFRTEISEMQVEFANQIANWLIEAKRLGHILPARPSRNWPVKQVREDQYPVYEHKKPDTHRVYFWEKDWKIYFLSAKRKRPSSQTRDIDNALWVYRAMINP